MTNSDRKDRQDFNRNRDEFLSKLAQNQKLINSIKTTGDNAFVMLNAEKERQFHMYIDIQSINAFDKDGYVFPFDKNGRRYDFVGGTLVGKNGYEFDYAVKRNILKTAKQLNDSYQKNELRNQNDAQTDINDMQSSQAAPQAKYFVTEAMRIFFNEIKPNVIQLSENDIKTMCNMTIKKLIKELYSKK